MCVSLEKSLIRWQIHYFVLTELGAGEIIYDLRKKIQKIQAELGRLGSPARDMPEMITSTNLLRSNEYLSKTDAKKTELLLAYKQYSKALEKLLGAVFEIQQDLKEILKVQSTLISGSPKRRTRKAKKR